MRRAARGTQPPAMVRIRTRCGPRPLLRREGRGSSTHQDLIVCPGDSDQAVLPGRANAWGLLDADVHDFWKVAEGLEDLGWRRRTKAGGPLPRSPQPLLEGNLDPIHPLPRAPPLSAWPRPALSYLALPNPTSSINPSPLKPSPAYP